MGFGGAAAPRGRTKATVGSDQGNERTETGFSCVLRGGGNEVIRRSVSAATAATRAHGMPFAAHQWYLVLCYTPPAEVSLARSGRCGLWGGGGETHTGSNHVISSTNVGE